MLAVGSYWMKPPYRRLSKSSLAPKPSVAYASWLTAKTHPIVHSGEDELISPRVQAAGNEIALNRGSIAGEHRRVFVKACVRGPGGLKNEKVVCRQLRLYGVGIQRLRQL